MKKKILLTSAVASAVVLLGAGCGTQQATNTNVVSNTNVATAGEAVNGQNSDVAVNADPVIIDPDDAEETVNENGAAPAATSEVDTSDWLTYSNEEYGFSLKYPKDWGAVNFKESIPNPGLYYVTFSNDVTNTPNLWLIETGHDLSREGDVPSLVNIAEINFSKPNSELENLFLNAVVSSVEMSREMVSSKEALKTFESGTNMAGDYEMTKYYIPYFQSDFHLLVLGMNTKDDILEEFVQTISGN